MVPHLEKSETDLKEDFFRDYYVFGIKKSTKLGQIENENKKYLGNTERLNKLAMLSMENEIAISIDFENILQDFAKKTRRVFF